MGKTERSRLTHSVKLIHKAHQSCKDIICISSSSGGKCFPPRENVIFFNRKDRSMVAVYDINFLLLCNELQHSWQLGITHYLTVSMGQESGQGLAESSA